MSTYTSLTTLNRLVRSLIRFDYAIWAANLLSISRVILMIPFLRQYNNGNFTMCIIICFVAMLTDWMDGMCARLSPTRHPIGKWIDPICDGIVMTAIVSILFIDNMIPLAFLVWLIARYIFFVAAALTLKQYTITIQSSFASKLSICFFALYGYTILFSLISPGWRIFILPTLYMTIIMQIVSLIQPIKLLSKTLSAANRKSAPSSQERYPQS